MPTSMQYFHATIEHFAREQNMSSISLFLKRLSTKKQKIFRPRTKENKYLMNVSDHGCKQLYPQVVLYNRIFKTASTAMTSFLEKCSRKLKYVVTKGK